MFFVIVQWVVRISPRVAVGPVSHQSEVQTQIFLTTLHKILFRNFNTYTVHIICIIYYFDYIILNDSKNYDKYITWKFSYRRIYFVQLHL